MNQGQVKRALESFYYSTVTGDRPGVKTWTYDPRTHMTVSVGSKQALKTALWMLGQVIRHPRSSVTVEMWSELSSPVKGATVTVVTPPGEANREVIV